jgi:hypothetical protein
VLHTYYGGYGRPKVAPAQGKEPVNVVDVAVDYTDRPVLVIAVAYEPQIWRFSLAPGVHLAGVQLFGYHEQYVDGIPAGTPLGRMYDVGRDGERLSCGDPQRATTRRQTSETISRFTRLVESRQRAFAAARTEAASYVKFYTELKRRQAATEAPPLPGGTDPETAKLIIAARTAATDELLALARSLAVEAADRQDKLRELLFETMDEDSQAKASVARLDPDGRMPPPFDGWFSIEYRDELDSLAADISMFGRYIYAGYRYLESTQEGSFVIRADGSIGPDPTARELLLPRR